MLREPREGFHVPVLSSPDPTVGIACILPVLEMADRLDMLHDLVADGLGDVLLNERRLRITIERDPAADLYAQTVALAKPRRPAARSSGSAWPPRATR